ncbi:MAG: TlpA family protein disulfide reductase [Bacteroidetes bacterium]|nr:TlpA family protein disulfide reductase [Bacteroidota bacterium]
MKKLILLLVTASLMVTFPAQLGHAQKKGKFYINRSITKTELIKKAAKSKDKIWVVDIWASWCVPCNAAVPELKSLYKEYKGKDVEFISVSYDVSKKQWVRAVRNHGMPWPQIINYNPPYEEDEFKWMFPHSAIPSIYIIDKDGTIDQMRGMRDLKYNLRALTAGK